MKGPNELNPESEDTGSKSKTGFSGKWRFSSGHLRGSLPEQPDPHASKADQDHPTDEPEPSVPLASEPLLGYAPESAYIGDQRNTTIEEATYVLDRRSFEVTPRGSAATQDAEPVNPEASEKSNPPIGKHNTQRDAATTKSKTLFPMKLLILIGGLTLLIFVLILLTLDRGASVPERAPSVPLSRSLLFETNPPHSALVLNGKLIGYTPLNHNAKSDEIITFYRPNFRPEQWSAAGPLSELAEHQIVDLVEGDPYPEQLMAYGMVLPIKGHDGAGIFVDDTFLGRIPIDIPITPGQSQLTLTAVFPGYSPTTLQVELARYWNEPMSPRSTVFVELGARLGSDAEGPGYQELLAQAGFPSRITPVKREVIDECPQLWDKAISLWTEGHFQEVLKKCSDPEKKKVAGSYLELFRERDRLIKANNISGLSQFYNKNSNWVARLKNDTWPWTINFWSEINSHVLQEDVDEILSVINDPRNKVVEAFFFDLANKEYQKLQGKYPSKVEFERISSGNYVEQMSYLQKYGDKYNSRTISIKKNISTNKNKTLLLVQALWGDRIELKKSTFGNTKSVAFNFDFQTNPQMPITPTEVRLVVEEIGTFDLIGKGGVYEKALEKKFIKGKDQIKYNLEIVDQFGVTWALPQKVLPLS